MAAYTDDVRTDSEEGECLARGLFLDDGSEAGGDVATREPESDCQTSRPCSRNSHYSLQSANGKTPRSERLQQRLQASVIGIKQLSELREKHRRMMVELTTHIDRPLHSATKPPKGDTVSQLRAHHSAASVDRASHRSSLSIDSGIVSLSSDIKDSQSDASCSKSGNCFDLRIRPSSLFEEKDSEFDSPSLCSVDPNDRSSAAYHELLNVEPERRTALADARSSIRNGSCGRHQHKKYRSRCSYYPVENTVLITQRSTTVKVTSGRASNYVTVEPQVAARDPYEPLSSGTIVRRKSTNAGPMSYVKRVAVARTLSGNVRKASQELFDNTTQEVCPEKARENFRRFARTPPVVEYNPRPKSLALPASRSTTPCYLADSLRTPGANSEQPAAGAVSKSQSVTSLRSTQSTPSTDGRSTKTAAVRRRTHSTHVKVDGNGHGTPGFPTDSDDFDGQPSVHVVLFRSQSGHANNDSLSIKTAQSKMKQWHESDGL